MMNHSKVRKAFGLLACSITLGASAVPAPHAWASGPKLPAATNGAWQSECGSCHGAYPPRLLPANSWRAIIDGLERHFGTDASIDAATATSIQSFLQANAGRARDSSTEPVLRITETRWFLREHRKIGASQWSSPKIGGAANCGACHQAAATGRFNEHDMRIPR